MGENLYGLLLIETLKTEYRKKRLPHIKEIVILRYVTKDT